MRDEILDIVDEKGKVIDHAAREMALQKGLLHPAVNVILFNSKGQIFIQKRSKSRSVYPLAWDVSTAEHLKQAETFIEAAKRGLKEELYVKGIQPKLIRKKHIQKENFKTHGKIIKDYELVELYLAVYDGEIKIDKKEVSKGRFVSFSKLKKMLNDKKILFTSWGRDEFEYLINHPRLESP